VVSYIENGKTRGTIIGHETLNVCDSSENSACNCVCVCVCEFLLTAALIEPKQAATEQHAAHTFIVYFFADWSFICTTFVPSSFHSAKTLSDLTNSRDARKNTCLAFMRAVTRRSLRSEKEGPMWRPRSVSL